MGKPEQAEKRVEHYAMAKAPDWKYTPAKPNKGTPVPYWTIAYFNLSVKTAPNSEGRGNDYFIARSRAPVSVRGELGRGGGVKSGTYMEEFEPSEWSNTLVISGSGAVFDGHKGWINKRNAPAKVYTNVNPDVAIADKACWEQLQTNLSALGISTVDKMKADPKGCGTELLGGAWGSISGDAKVAGDALGSIWGGFTSFFSDPVGSVQSAASALKKYGQQAYEAGKQVAELVQGLSDGSITMDDLLEFAGDMLQKGLCDVAQELEQKIKDGKGCEAIGYLLGQVATTIALTMAGGAVAGKAAQTATKAAEMMAKMGISKGDSLAEMIRKMKKYKKERKEVGGDDHPSKPRTPTSDDSGTPGNKRNPQCPLCPVVGKRPVNPVLGVKVLAGGEDMDFNLPAPLPLPWQRTYVSNNGHAGWLGQGWSVPFGAHVVEKRTQKGIIFVLVDEFGRDIKFSYLTPGQSQLNRYEQIVLRMLDDGRLTLEGTNAEVKLTFTELPLAPRRTLRRFAISAMEDRNGNAVRLVHNELGEPTHITDSAGRTLVLRFDDVGVATQRAVKPLRRLTAISWVDFVGNKAQHRPLVAYQYDDQGDLVAVLDRVGRVARQFEYRNHILVAHSVPGVAARYHYSIDSPKGKVLRSEISTGESFAFEYFKHHTQVTDNLGRVELYHFNEFKEWTGTTDAAGGFTERKLDGFGNLIGVTDPAGRTTRYAYDDKGRLTRVQEPNASLLDLNTISIGYDSKLGLPTEVTLADGAKTEYQYDEVGNLVKATDALGHVTRYALDQRGLPITVVDALGKSKLLRYNQSGQLIQYVDCSNQPTNYTYDVWGQLTSVIDALGNAVRYSYNETGTLAAVIHADGGVERFAYDTADRLIAYADPLGNITEYTLSPDGRPLARRNAEGGELRYEYDEALRLLTLHNENNASYDFSYDVLDRLTEETGFDGRNTQYRYDRTGLILAKLENGCLTAAQRLEKRLEREAQVGDPGDASVPAQRTTPTMDDPWGLGLADETAPLMAPPGYAIHTRYQRDAAGRLLAKEVAGKTLSLNGSARPQFKVTRYAYDVRGRLTEAINDGGSRTTLAYDLLSQVVEEARTGQGLAHRLQHQYDALGNRTQTALPDGRRINWLYYGSGHLHQINIDGRIISDMERDGLHREIRRTQGQLQSRYGYDAVGRLTAQATWHASPSDGDALNAGAARPGAWQALGDEIDPQAGAQRSIPAEALVLGRRYQYDLAGNLQTIHDSRNGATQYRYDRIGRILAAMQPQLDERFAFDPAHNMLPVSGRQGEAGGSNGLIKDNRLEVFEDKRFSYDTHGNLIEKKIGKHTVMRFEWDVEHQLQSAKVTKAAHTGKPVQTQTNYRYDAFGRRLEKQGMFASTLFEWDGNRLLAEQKDSQQTLYLYEADSFAPLAQVCVEDRASAHENPAELRAIQSGALNEDDEADWQPRQSRQAFDEDMRNALRVTAGQMGQSQPAAMAANDEKEAHDPSGLPAPQADKVVRLEDWKVRYYHNDHLGTPRELSGEQGNALWSATYQAWGNTLRVVQERATEIVQYRAGPLDERVEQNLRFQGQYFDEETGLHYNRFRYYDPDVGRFVSQDPIGIDGGENLYQYAPSPNAWVDPLGLKREDCKNCDERECELILEKLQGYANQANAALAAQPNKGLSPSQVMHVNDGNRWAYAMHYGTQLDKAVKDLVRADPFLSSKVSMPAKGPLRPDFENKNKSNKKCKWFDLTTQGSWAAHVSKYRLLGQGRHVTYSTP